MSFGSNLLYVWTAGGSLASMTIPPSLIPAHDTSTTETLTKKTESPVIESFVDNLRRTVSNINQYSEIPYNNILTTRLAREPLPIFKFLLLPNKKYKLNIHIRAKIDYKYRVPILVKYYLETNRVVAFMNYRASYISSNETVMGAEKTVNTLNTPMSMVVDSKLTIIRIEATFQTNTNLGTGDLELRLHHGLQTDDPEATLYCLEGSIGVLTELIPTSVSV